MGTPEFAVPCLEKLIAGGHEIAAVFTQTDKPKGRGLALYPPPVKEAALRRDLPVFQPKTLRGGEAAETLRALRPDLIAVVAYGKILPPDVLAIPPLGCVNVHASLLPKLRGAAPIQWAVIRGEKESGVTTMHMAEGIDTGDMILRESVPIGENETAGSLHDQLMKIGAELLAETVRRLADGTAPREKQDDRLATWAPLLDRALAKIDWSRPAAEIHNLCRGLAPSPGAQTFFDGKGYKIRETRRTSGKAGGAPGTVVFSGESGIGVVCGDGELLAVAALQEQGKRTMSAAEYLRGHKLSPGARFE